MSDRWVRKLLRGRNDFADDVWISQKEAASQALVILRAYYCASAFFLFQALSAWESWQGIGAYSRIWLVHWIPDYGIPTTALVAVVAGLASTLSAATWPENRLLRLLACTSCLIYAAVENSRGKVNHGWHAWIWVGFIFTFPPGASFRKLGVTRALRQQFLNGFWLAQFVVLFFYTLAGIQKIAAIPVQFLRGEVTALHPQALALHIATKLRETNEQSLVGDFFVRNAWVSFPAWLSAIYLEFFSIVVAFRPRLHRLWGLALIAMHIAIGATMTIWFSKNVLLLGLLFICSPFAGTIRLTAQMTMLPGVHEVLRCWSALTTRFGINQPERRPLS